MNIGRTWNNALSLLVSPARTWRAISIRETGRSAFGFLALCAIVVGLASCLHLLMANDFPVALHIGALTAVMLTANALLVTILTRVFASHFGSTATFGRSLQVVVFSLTPSFIGLTLIALTGFNILFIFLFSAYSVIILYRGLSPMLATPQKHRILFTVLIALSTLLLAVIDWLLLQRLQ